MAGRTWPLVYFWLTGILSAFLDNAPTYLVFFELAGIRPTALSGADGVTLAAISAGAVFFGGLTYIGNAPNMMLRAIAAHRGVRMPGFFGFARWRRAVAAGRWRWWACCSSHSARRHEWIASRFATWDRSKVGVLPGDAAGPDKTVEALAKVTGNRSAAEVCRASDEPPPAKWSRWHLSGLSR